MHKKQIHLEKNTLKFPYIGREWQVLRANMEELWEKMVDDTPMHDKDCKNSYDEKVCDKNICDKDERLPYWAELWPSSLALAKWLETNRKNIEQKLCMDLGCGLGFTALCGASLGACVMGVDYEADAIALAKENAVANDFRLVNFSCFHENISHTAVTPCSENLVNIFTTGDMSGALNTSNEFNAQLENCNDCIDFKVMDWRAPCISEHSLDFIWAADIVYERAFVTPILNFLKYALKDTGKAWIAEPGRAIFEHFPEMLKHTSFKMQRVSNQETEELSVHIPKAHVNIWEITRC